MTPEGGEVYESAGMLADYLLFHYGSDEDLMPWAFGPRDSLHYPVRCAGVCHRAAGGVAGRVLDLGCAVGRSSFEISRWAGQVVGMDWSRQFIEAAQILQDIGEMAYGMKEEGEVEVSRLARIPESARKERVVFRRGDACHLPEDLGRFDGALLANLLCRLPDPARCLEGVSGLLNPGGWLVLATPASWSGEFTPREKWLGGCGGQTTLGGIRECLEPLFEMESREDMPFVLREHRRKYQWTVAEVSVWRKKK